MPTGTVRLHRVLTAPPEKVYRAFVQPDALARWLPPDGYTAKFSDFAAQVGARYHASFTSFTTGATQGFSGEYLELVPNERLVYTDRFDDPGLPGTIQVTVTLRAVPLGKKTGTELTILQEGIPEQIPVEGCYVSWQQSLQYLARLVEPDIEA